MSLLAIIHCPHYIVILKEDKYVNVCSENTILKLIECIYNSHKCRIYTLRVLSLKKVTKLIKKGAVAQG